MKLCSIAVLIAALVAGCSPSQDPPARGNYSLSWYPREGTDYGPLIPGFKSLAMCRRAGVGMTLERLIERFGTSSEVSEQRQGSKGASS